MSISPRKTIHLPKKVHPFTSAELQVEAAQFAVEKASVRVEALSAQSPHAIPPKGAPPRNLLTTEQRLSRRERRHGVGIVDLSQPGFLRLDQVLLIFPVSRASWYAGLGTIYPNSVRIGPRSVAWRTEDIRALVENPPKFARD